MNPIGMRLVFGTPMSPRTLLAATIGVSGVALLFLPELRQASHGGNAGYGRGVRDRSGTAVACVGNLVAMRNNKRGIAVFPSHGMGNALRRS